MAEKGRLFDLSKGTKGSDSEGNDSSDDEDSSEGPALDVPALRRAPMVTVQSTTTTTEGLTPTGDRSPRSHSLSPWRKSKDQTLSDGAAKGDSQPGLSPRLVAAVTNMFKPGPPSAGKEHVSSPHYKSNNRSPNSATPPATSPPPRQPSPRPSQASSGDWKFSNDVVTPPPRNSNRLGIPSPLGSASTSPRKLQLDGESCSSCDECSHFRPTAINPAKCDCGHRKQEHQRADGAHDSPTTQSVAAMLEPPPTASVVPKLSLGVASKVSIPVAKDASTLQQQQQQQQQPARSQQLHGAVTSSPVDPPKHSHSPIVVKQEQSGGGPVSPDELSTAVGNLGNMMQELEARFSQGTGTGALYTTICSQTDESLALCGRADSQVILNLWVVQSYLKRFEQAIKDPAVSGTDATLALEAVQKASTALSKIPQIK